MANTDKIKRQRDQFLAFAFAASDLLVEVSHEDRVTFALGAIKAITGVSDQSLVGKNWLELFSPYDQTTIQAALNNVKPGKRVGPMVLTLSDSIGGRKAIVTGIRMPEDPNAYLTISFTSALMEDIAAATPQAEPADILDRDSFIHMAQSTLLSMKEFDEAGFLTLLDLTPVVAPKEKIGADDYKEMIDTVERHILKHAQHHAIAGRFGKTSYAFVHNKAVSVSGFADGLLGIVKEAVPDCALENITNHTLKSNLESILKRDMVWALVKALDEFEKDSNDYSLTSLQDALDLHKKDREHRLKELKGSIERVSFTFAYQPVVDMTTNKEDHFEIRCRFEDGGHTREWIILAEEEGLVKDFDLAISERVINHIKFKEGGTTRRFSMNVHGNSLDDDEFCETILERFTKNKDIAKRLIFEVIGAGKIKRRSRVNQLFKNLRDLGYKIALDDIEIEQESIDNVSDLTVDFIKVTSRCTRELLTMPDTRLAYQNFLAQAQAANRKVIAKGIEKAEHADALDKLGVKYGQGYFFGKPDTKPVFNAAKD